MDSEEKIRVDKHILQVQEKHSVSYAGAVAGYQQGVHLIDAKRKILVTDTTLPMKLEAGEWNRLRELLLGLLGEEQFKYLCGWIKIFITDYLKSLELGAKANLMPHQALALCGPRNCGKTLLKSLLIAAFGGRSAKPYQYMAGATAFNADMIEAPLLEIDDEAPSRDPRTRSRLAARIKELTVSGSVRVHAKYKQPIMLRPCQRLVLCVNDEPECMMVLPQIDYNFADKIMLFKVTRPSFHELEAGTHTRQQFWDMLHLELSHFLHHLLNAFEIPNELKEERFGLKHFHHPDLLIALDDLSQDSVLLEMIDRSWAENGFTLNKLTGDKLIDFKLTPWTGTALECEDIVRAGCNVGQANNLFRHPNSCGMLLGSLAKRLPERVKRDTKIRGFRNWVIMPPPTVLAELEAMQQQVQERTQYGVKAEEAA